MAFRPLRRMAKAIMTRHISGGRDIRDTTSSPSEEPLIGADLESSPMGREAGGFAEPCALPKARSNSTTSLKIVMRPVGSKLRFNRWVVRRDRTRLCNTVDGHFLAAQVGPKTSESYTLRCRLDIFRDLHHRFIPIVLVELRGIGIVGKKVEAEGAPEVHELSDVEQRPFGIPTGSDKAGLQMLFNLNIMLLSGLRTAVELQIIRWQYFCAA